ncbi:alpha/beta-Hydrolases superfamily protein [Striga asiatica]|uniref:Alpha/beta-Hydrolases superfamily protein n=1 Tax=Striga asiatica TaxID=4170 RepID=A0A5A7QI91_STRAF|nr:alpha/beta-Hydrolases superfamily protein [Striga asiatica]
MENTGPHRDAFDVCGPHNVPSISWKDLISSTWKDSNYKRTVIACFIQAVYLLELDRQENRKDQNALAPKWWTPFKYKLTEILTDERDGSIFGAVLEWDRSAALSHFILTRPNGAPQAILAFRGTLLKTPTIRRDIEDDLRFLAWESLKGSIRFGLGLKALRKVSEKYGSRNVCLAGHSLGAGFALQVGKALAKQGVCVEAHLFNPPSVSLASGLKTVGESVGYVWDRVRSMLPYVNGDGGAQRAENGDGSKRLLWVPHLYINSGDYICCYYTDGQGGGARVESGPCLAKVLVFSKGGKQKFVEAHGLEQWWSSDMELEMALNSSKLISRQLKSLYSLPPSE